MSRRVIRGGHLRAKRVGGQPSRGSRAKVGEPPRNRTENPQNKSLLRETAPLVLNPQPLTRHLHGINHGHFQWPRARLQTQAELLRERGEYTSPRFASIGPSTGIRENAKFHSNSPLKPVASTAGRSSACWMPRISSAIGPAFRSVVTQLKGRASSSGAPQHSKSPLASRGVDGSSRFTPAALTARQSCVDGRR